MINHTEFQIATDYILSNKSKNFELLLSQHPLLSSIDHDGESLLHLSSDNNCLEISKVLLSHGANPDCQNSIGETPLHIAVFRGHLEIVTLLLNHKADINILTNDKKSALNYAEDYQELDIKDLLQFHSDVFIDPLTCSYSLSSDRLLSLDSLCFKETVNEKTRPFTTDNQDSTGSFVKHYTCLDVETKRLASNEDIFNFLWSIQLNKHFKSFIENGFDHLPSLVIQMNTDLPIDHDLLKGLGVEKSGDRSKLLISLEKISRNTNLFSRFKEIDGLLEHLNLEEFKNGFGELKMSLDELAVIAEDFEEFDRTVLISKVGIKKIGHRMRILGTLRMINTQKRTCSII